MAQVLINFRIDADLKKQLDKTCEELGMNMSTAFIIFAKKMCREQRIPFDVSIDPFFSESNMKVLNQSIDQLNAGKVITKTLDELKALEDE